jgi:hypothetical protein
VVALLLLLASWAGYRRGPGSAARNGPAKLLFSRPIRSSNEVSVFQQEGWEKSLLLLSRDTNWGITNGLMFELTNQGPQTVVLVGANSSSPFYMIYVDGTNGLERLEPPSPLLLTGFLLGPTQSLSFPVIPPLTDRPWHVEVSYTEHISPFAAVLRPRTRLERLVEEMRALTPFPRRSSLHSWFTMSDSITPTIAPDRKRNP